jgi:hypothetical protein
MLIVDDEYLVRTGIRETIDWSLYDIEIIGEATNGKLGLNMALELSSDIIISDVKMPIMDGIQLADELSIEFKDTLVSASGNVVWTISDTVFNLRSQGQRLSLPVRVTSILERRNDRLVFMQFHASLPASDQPVGKSIPGNI